MYLYYSSVPTMMDECLKYLEERRKLGISYEIIVVSDGSTDKTVEVAHSYAKEYNTVRVLALKKNRGKGGAVRLVSIFSILNDSLKFIYLKVN
jgi:dolichyl-phosphate beta-glucosyltransferase